MKRIKMIILSIVIASGVFMIIEGLFIRPDILFLLSVGAWFGVRYLYKGEKQ